MFDFSVTFIITIINIAVLFFILRAILFKPVTKFMAQRARRVQDSIELAEKDKVDARKLLAQYEARLKNADAEVQNILRAARESAEQEARRIVYEGKETAANIIDNTRRQMESERLAAYAKFRTEAAIIVMAAVSRLAGREINSDDNRRYATMLLDELAARKGSN